MTADPFRDLFVELPRAVFDAMHAWGEAVIVKAQTPTPVVPVVRIPTVLDRTTLLSWRYGWRRAETQRVESDRATEISALLECGHWQRYVVTDKIVAFGPPEQIDIVDRVVDSTPRDCYCVQRKS